jgi:hypothetical protein
VLCTDVFVLPGFEGIRRRDIRLWAPSLISKQNGIDPHDLDRAGQDNASLSPDFSNMSGAI